MPRAFHRLDSPAGLGIAFVALLASCGGATHDAGRASSPPRSAASPSAAASVPRLRPWTPTPQAGPIQGARYVPDSLEGAATYGVDPGGGVRALVGGVRVLAFGEGALVTTKERFLQAPTRVLPLPDRLGGGFVFQLGADVRRSESWLGETRVIHKGTVSYAGAAAAPLQAIFAGFDRLYVRDSANVLSAIDPKSGATIDLGTWPRAPSVGTGAVAGFAAVDGWRGLAIADLLGPVYTEDGGATWTKVHSTGVDFSDVRARGNRLLATARDGGRPQPFEIGSGGSAVRTSHEAGAGSESTTELLARVRGSTWLGGEPLAIAVTEGWPLGDGSALVAQRGNLARIRLDDGSIAEVVEDAFREKSARCAPIPLAPAEASAGFGFVCGEVQGRTRVYAVNATTGSLDPLLSFEGPRVVAASGTGGLVVRGGCAAPTADAYCAHFPDGTNRDLRLRGADGRERIAALADGRAAIVSPGRPGEARLTLESADGTSRSLPIQFPKISADISKVLRHGLWLDGIEERRPNVVGGWIEASGIFLGWELTLDRGTIAFGEYVRELGTPMVSGRYGLGWLDSSRGYETVDGGMTWRSIETFVARASTLDLRGCGPIGCNARGWLRVGWGAASPPATTATSGGATPPTPFAAIATLARPLVGPTYECEPETRGQGGATAPKPSLPSPRALPQLRTMPFEPQVPPAPQPLFHGLPSPAARADERVLTYDALEPLEHYPRLGVYARAFAIGPKSGDFEERNARFVVRWLDAFSPWTDVKSSAPIALPATFADAARAFRSLPVPYSSHGAFSAPGGLTLSLAQGDDADHALLVVRKNGKPDVAIFVLESGRPAQEVRRADGEPIFSIDGAVRVGRNWYVGTSQAPGESAAAVVLRVDGGLARELARAPRTVTTPARLAARADGSAIGIVVEAAGTGSVVAPGVTVKVATSNQRWVLPIDLDGRVGTEAQPLGATDLGDPGMRVSCAELPPNAWTYATAWTGTSTIHVRGERTGPLVQQYVRLRLDGNHACIERAAGSLDSPMTPIRKGVAGKRGATMAGARESAETTKVTLTTGGERYLLSCHEWIPSPLARP